MTGVALGLIAAGPWDESSQQSIRDDTADKKVALEDIFWALMNSREFIFTH